MPFSVINKVMTKKVLAQVIDYCYRNLGIKSTCIFADQLMYTG